MMPIATGTTVVASDASWADECNVIEQRQIKAYGKNIILPDRGDKQARVFKHPILQALLAQPATHSAAANCTITAADTGLKLVATRDIVTDTRLLLQYCPVTVLSQCIPPLLRSCDSCICEGFLIDTVPKDSGHQGGCTAVIDGYISMTSLTHLVCMAPHCTHCAVIGCGYGETLCLMSMVRQCTVVGFEPISGRRTVAENLAQALSIGDQVSIHGALATFEGTWRTDPCLIWCNNIRFNDDDKCNIPRDLLSGRSFPGDGSYIVTMVPYAGEEAIPLCVCGSCYAGFCESRGADGCCVIRNDTAHFCMQPKKCGPVKGFWDKGRNHGSGLMSARVMLRIQSPDIRFVPFGAGSGHYTPCIYQTFTSTQAPPTPHAGMTYSCIVLTKPSDLTAALHEQLRFVERSSVVDGPLQTNSLIFHGVDREELGIDAAIVFTVTEPGGGPIVYAYRTLAVVRDCSMRAVVRLNQDIIVDGMQGRSFINQINLQTAQVIRNKLPMIEWIAIEPDREIMYHLNYANYGFLWELQKPPLDGQETPPCFAEKTVGKVRPPRTRDSPYELYRKQIDLDPDRYKTMFFEVPARAKKQRV